MLRGILVPRELVNEAFRTVAAKLKAKETKFFAHKGRVVSKVDVEAHGTQLAAADQVFSLAGLYAREREAPSSTPMFALEVDSRTGVVRMVVGGQTAIDAPPPPRELALVEASPAESVVVETHAEVVKPRRVPIPDVIWKLVSDEVVD
jgi:hypothetical protein